MRKISWTLLYLAVLPIAAMSQKTGFGITVGTALANVHLKYGGASVSAENKLGATAGVFLDMPFSKQASFRPGLNFVQKGSRTSEPGYKDKLTLNYIEIPLDLVFKPTMQNVQLFIGVGPSIAFAVSGKEKETDNGNVYTYKYKFGNNPDEHDMKRMDIGYNMLIGVQLKKGFIACINYNLGLSDVSPGSSSEGSVKNRYFGFKVGYVLKSTDRSTK
jgi:hypothetical protein